MFSITFSHSVYKKLPDSRQSFDLLIVNQQSCQAEEKEVKVLEKEAPSVTGKSYVTISRVSPNQPSVVLHEEEVSNVSLDSSMKRPVVS